MLTILNDEFFEFPGNALDELRRVIAVLQSPHAHTAVLPPTPVSYDLLQGFPGKLFHGVPELQGLQSLSAMNAASAAVTASGPSTDITVTGDLSVSGTESP